MMYLMSHNSIGTILYRIYKYHHYDNALTTPLVSYYLYDDRLHEYLSIDVSYVLQFDRYVISSILIIIITITHTQFRLFLIVSTTIIDIGSGTIGDNRCHECTLIDVFCVPQFDRYVT